MQVEFMFVHSFFLEASDNSSYCVQLDYGFL